MKSRLKIRSWITIIEVSLISWLMSGPAWAQTNPQGNCPNMSIDTALGCVNTTPGGVVEWLLGKLIGIGGALAMLLILRGLLILSTSGGDPQKIKEATEGITAAVAGLLFVIFAVLLLKIIGVDILALPGFSSS